MADAPQEERTKAVTDAAAAARAAHAEHVPEVPLLPAFSTRETGEVINHKGQVVFTPPKLPEFGKKRK